METLKKRPGQAKLRVRGLRLESSDGAGVLDLGQGSFVARQKDGSHVGGLCGFLRSGRAGFRNSMNS